MKNKKVADRLLIILLLAFTSVNVIKYRIYDSFYIDMLSFVLEAALIGGIADWFAITALYKKPLGFSWHTAIIPRNRDKLIDAVSNIVEHELLSQQAIRDKIQDINFINLIISFIDNSFESHSVTSEFIEKYGSKLLDFVDTEKLAFAAEKGIKTGLHTLPIKELVNKSLINLMDSGAYEKPLEELIDYLTAAVATDKSRQEIFEIINDLINKNMENQKGIKKTFMKLALGVAEGTDSVNAMDAAVSIQNELQSALTKLKSSEDPNHIKLLASIRNSIERSASEETMLQAMSNWRSDTIESINLYNELKALIESFKESIILMINNSNMEDSPSTSEMIQNNYSPYTDNISSVIGWAKKQLASYWIQFKSNEALKASFEAVIKDFICKILDSKHAFIGSIVKRCLSNLTDEALNEFIDKKAGNDLNWIRINGCIVGAVFGLIVFLFTTFIYGPLF